MTKIEEYLKEIENKKLLVLFPHPDDESFMAGGLIMRAKKLGFEVEVVTLTSGQRGKNYKKGSVGELGEIRREEFNRAVSLLGVRGEILEYQDGSLNGNREWVGEVREIIKSREPGVVVTYDHSGITGHPDHIALSVEIFRLLKEEFPDTALLWPAWPGRRRKFMVNKEVAGLMQKADFKLNLTKEERDIKYSGIMAHESQFGNLSFIQRLLMKYLVIGTEYFALADYEREYGYKYVDFEF